jgi:Ca-activated chloride channel homolog
MTRLTALFATPALLWLLLLAPAVAAASWWLWRRRLAAAAQWASRGLWRTLAPGHHQPRTTLSALLVGLAVLAVTLGLARPRWGETSERVQRQGVDVVFVLDSSLSMAATDVLPSRLFAAKTLIRRLAENLPGNRVALVEAEGEGLVLAPLTTDAAVLDLLLDTVGPGSLPVPGTLLAPALREAMRLFPEGGKKHRAIVLFSDGEDQGSALADVTRELQEAGVIVHTLGIGTPQGSPLPVAGSAGGYKRDRDGQVVVSRLGEAVLENLAKATGGTYLRVTNSAADPAAIAARIHAMATRSLDTEVTSTLEERFQWPLALAVAALVLGMLRGPFRGTQPIGSSHR